MKLNRFRKWRISNQETGTIYSSKTQSTSPPVITKEKERFQQIMAFANQLEEVEDLQACLQFIGRSVELQIIVIDLFREETRRPLGPHLLQEYLLFNPYTAITPDNKNLLDLIVEEIPSRTITLGKDTVLAEPWKESKLVRALSIIGEGKNWGQWQQEDNHEVIWWEPLQVGWVKKGNHSIASGIIQCQGEIIPDETFDISPIYQYVDCDGDRYYCKHNDTTLNHVNVVEFAAMFEIGRLIFEKQNSMESRISD